MPFSHTSPTGTHMNWDEFAQWGARISDWAADYHKTLRERPVRERPVVREQHTARSTRHHPTWTLKAPAGTPANRDEGASDGHGARDSKSRSAVLRVRGSLFISRPFRARGSLLRGKKTLHFLSDIRKPGSSPPSFVISHFLDFRRSEL